jgi:hypothetical protein
MHELFDAARQQALIEAAAAKAAHNLRPKPTHKDTVAAKCAADSNNTLSSDFEPAPVRPHAAHGHRGDPDSDDDDRLVTAAQVKRRYGNASDMWLWRRLHDESGFPQPLFICGRRFWRLAALIAWEHARAMGAA